MLPLAFYTHFARLHVLARLARAIRLWPLTLVLLAWVHPAVAQTPDPGSLRILVGFAPGGSADVIARLMAVAMQSDFKSVIVENRVGAGGRIALQQVKNAKADGQTVIVLPSGPMVMFPHVYSKLDYDPVKDFTPISLLARFQFGLVSGPASHVKSLAEMIARTKADPSSATYGTAGAGTLPHFLGVLLEQTTGMPLQHIPFPGGAPANNALLGGHIGYKFDVVSETAELHRTGKVRIIAVTGPTRDPQVPEVPTLKESGVNMEATAWFAMYAPAGLKPEVQAWLEQAVMKAVRQSSVRDKLVALGYEPVGSNGAQLAETQRADLLHWEKPLKAAHLQLD